MVTVYSENAFAEYNGSEQTGSGTVAFGNMVSGQIATITYNPAKGRIPGTYTGSFEDDFRVMAGEENVTANYVLGAKTPGNLTIGNRAEKYSITVTGKSSTGNIYDGTEKSAKGFETSEFTVEGNKFTVSGLAASGPVSTDACNMTNTVSGTAVVRDAYGNIVTDQFTVETVNGTLEIRPAAVTVTAQDKVFAYNGTAQRWPKYDVNGLIGSDAISAVVTGSITWPEESPVVNILESYQFTAGKPENYKVTTADGTLTMTNAAITITAGSQEWTYDGAAHSNSTVTVMEGKLLSGDTLVAEAAGSVTNVADTKAGNNPVAEGHKVLHGNTDVTGNYAITPVAGTLTITRADAAIKAAPKATDPTYSGSAQELVTAGEAIGGKIQYALGTAANATEPYATSIPAKTEARTYYVWYMVKGDENHTDTKAACVTVVIAEQTQSEPPETCTVTFDANGGTGKMEAVTVTKGTEYTLPECGFTAPSNRKFDTWDKGAPGTKITVTGNTVIKAKWADSKPGKTDIGQAKVSKIKDQAYTGKKIKPKLTVKYNGKKLKEGTDYTVKWEKNKNIGTAKATIKGKGSYKGSKEVTFKIIPKAVKLTELEAAGKKELAVKWKKGSSIDGYQIEYSRKEDFSESKKVTVKGADKTSRKIRKLKKGKAYYVRIRTFKKSGGKTYYSKWSGVLKKKVK